MEQTIIFHAEIASALETVIVFRFLSDPNVAAGNQQFTVAKSKSDISCDLEMSRSTITTAVTDGVTPLAALVREILANIVQLSSTLRHMGQLVALIIATDGLPKNRSGALNQFFPYF
jgi:hypothetical protein